MGKIKNTIKKKTHTHVAGRTRPQSKQSSFIFKAFPTVYLFSFSPRLACPCFHVVLFAPRRSVLRDGDNRSPRNKEGKKLKCLTEETAVVEAGFRCARGQRRAANKSEERRAEEKDRTGRKKWGKPLNQDTKSS